MRLQSQDLWALQNSTGGLYFTGGACVIQIFFNRQQAAKCKARLEKKDGSVIWRVIPAVIVTQRPEQ